MFNSEDIMLSENSPFPNDPYTCEEAVLSITNDYIKEETPNTDMIFNHLTDSGNPTSTRTDGNSNLMTEIANIEDHTKKETHLIKYVFKEGKYVKMWECGICGKEFDHQYILLRHVPTHTGARKYQCNICGKTFRQMSTLCQHKAIHSVARPYTCEVCQKSFNRASTLMSHKKTHTGLKPHKCPYCDKAFHQNGNLRNHVFTHTNERPYKCELCDKGFNQLSNLNNHKIKIHPEVQKPRYKCTLCSKEFSKRKSCRNHELFEHQKTRGSETLTSSATSSSSEPNSSRDRQNATAITNVKYNDSIIVDPINTDPMKIEEESLCMSVHNPGPNNNMDEGNIINSMNERLDEPECDPFSYFQDFDDYFTAQAFAMSSEELPIIDQNNITPVLNPEEYPMNSDDIILTDLDAMQTFISDI